MKRLLTLSALATALFFAQPAQAQQQNNQAEDIYHQMEMMPDSTMQAMMGKMMNNPQMRQMMMRVMMQNMHGDSTMMSGMMNHMKSDSTMSHDMMDGMMNLCMKMCMKHMMEGDMDKDMHHDMNMHHMQKNKNGNNKMNKNEG